MNRALGLLIALLYFGGYYICSFFDNGNIDLYWDYKVAMYSAIIILAWKYKPEENIIEDFFTSIIANDIYVLIFNLERDYSLNDLYFVLTFTALQYAKSKRHIIISYYRQLVIVFNNKNKKT